MTPYTCVRVNVASSVIPGVIPDVKEMCYHIQRSDVRHESELARWILPYIGGAGAAAPQQRRDRQIDAFRDLAEGVSSCVVLGLEDNVLPGRELLLGRLVQHVVEVGDFVVAVAVIIAGLLRKLDGRLLRFLGCLLGLLVLDRLLVVRGVVI